MLGALRERIIIKELRTDVNQTTGEEITEFQTIFELPCKIRQTAPSKIRNGRAAGFTVPDYMAKAVLTERITADQYVEYRGKILRVLAVRKDYEKEMMEIELTLDKEMEIEPTLDEETR